MMFKAFDVSVKADAPSLSAFELGDALLQV